MHTTAFVLMVGAGHSLARKARVSPEDVYQAGIITAALGSQEWAPYRVGLEVDGVQARLLAAQACLGVMGVFVPSYAEQLAMAGLRPLRLEVPPPPSSACS